MLAAFDNQGQGGSLCKSGSMRIEVSVIGIPAEIVSRNDRMTKATEIVNTKTY